MATKTRRPTITVVLNKTTIAALKVPAKGRVYYHDARQAGLAVCVTEAGAKTWYLYRWANGRPLRQRLGTTDEMTPEQARTVARQLTGEIAQGIDVQARKLAAREEMTFGELFGRWMDYSRQHKRTWQEDQRKFNKFLTAWAARRLSDIDTSDIERLHHRVKVQSGPYQANRVLAMIKAMFAKAITDRAWRGGNPSTVVKKFQEHTRERFLRPDEMQKFFAALATVPPDYADFFLLLLLTGQRRGAVQAMRWADLDLDGGLWTVPAAASKNKLPLTLPLAPKAVERLLSRLDGADGSPYVFPATGVTGHLVEPRKAWDHVRQTAGLPDLRMHDLRRTLGSWQAANGVSMLVIGKSLGHAADSKATSVYARLQVDPVRKALTDATAAMIAAGEPNPPKKPKGGRKNATSPT
jgi:integrase